jgi:hypothetical protein
MVEWERKREGRVTCLSGRRINESRQEMRRRLRLGEEG